MAQPTSWRAFLIDARTGKLGDELTAFGSQSIEDTLGQPIKTQVSIPKAQARGLIPWRDGVAVFCGDTVVAAGPLSNVPRDDGRDWAMLPFASLEAVFEFWHVLGVSEHSDDLGLRTAAASHVDAGSLGSVAWNVVKMCMARLGGLPIVHGSPFESGSVGYPDIPTWDLEKNTVGQILAAIQEGDGPDITFWPRMSDGDRIEWVMVHGTKAQPTISQDRVPTVDLTAPGARISQITPSRDWGNLATRVYGTGAGQEAGKLVSMAYVEPVRQLGVIPRERLINDSTDDYPTLARLVDGEALVSSHPLIQLDVELDVDDPEAGIQRWRPGLACQLVVGHDWLDLDAGVSTWRMIARSITPGKSTYTIKLQPEED